jgi:flagellar basal body-associated protein FliL
MLVFKIIAVMILVLIGLFLLSVLIYFFNLDMKFASKLIKPLNAYYDWAKQRRDAKKESSKE